MATKTLLEDLTGLLGLRRDTRRGWPRPWVVAMVSGTIVVLAGVVLFLPPSVLLLIILSTVALLGMLRWPAQSIMAAVLSRLLIDLFWWVEWTLIGLNLMEIYTGATAILIVLQVVLHAERIQRHPLFMPVVLLGGVLMAGALSAPDLRVGMEGLIRYYLPFVLMLLVTTLLEERQVWQLLKALLVVGAVPLITSVNHLIQGDFQTNIRLDFGRLAGAYGALHTHAHVMTALSAVGLVGLTLAKRRTTQLFLLAYTGVALVNLYYSHVRTAQLGLVIFAAVFYTLGRRMIPLVLLAVGGGVVLLSSYEIRSGLSDIPSFIFLDPVATDVDELGSGRVGIWRASIGNFFSHPPHQWLLGLGLGQQYALSPSGTLDSHSDFLALFFQTGFMGLSLYVWTLVRVSQRALAAIREWAPGRVRTYAHALVAATAVVVFSNTISNAYVARVTSSWLFWTAVGALYVLTTQRASGAQEQEEPGASARLVAEAPHG